MTTDVRVLDPAHRDYLTAHAITDEVIDAAGIYSDTNAAGQPEIVFTWRDGASATTQRRPWPGESGQYFWEKDRPLHFNVLREGDPGAPVLLVEGTKQSFAVASWAPERYAVYGMAGAWGWAKCDLARFADRDVFVVLDGDAADSLDVYQAGEKLAEALVLEDAATRFLQLPVQGKDGADDFLASRPAHKRGELLDKLVSLAIGKPSRKKPLARSRKPAATAAPDVGDRVPVAVNLDRQQVIAQILEAMRDRWDARYLYDFGGALTALKGARTAPLEKGQFLKLLTDAVAAFHYTPPADNRPAKFEPGWPDGQTVDAVLSSAASFSPLHRVVRVPFIRPDGTLCDKPGYDPATKTVLVLDEGMDRLSVPLEPSRADVDAAVALLLDDWLGDFSFHKRADRANALAMVLTPFIRGSVPLVPLAVVSGLQMGVGKNLLADCLAVLATGKASIPLPYVQDEDETRKQITSAFRSGTDLFIFDEAHEIEGKQFARAITSVTYTDRILGVSTMVEFPNNVTWISLGNQVTVNADMSRRVYFVNLRPADANPQDREGSAFRHPELREWTGANRPELVAAVLTLVRAWYAAGSPQYSRGSAMGSFETWDRMASGILGFAGVPGFLEDAATQRSESDFTGSMWSAHVAWLREVFEDREFTTKQVQDAALRHSDTWEAPPSMEDVADKGYNRRLGQAYARHQDRWFDGRKLVKSGVGHKSTIKWAVHLQGGTSGAQGLVNGTDPTDGDVPGADHNTTGANRGADGRVTTSSTLPGQSGVSTAQQASPVKDGVTDMSSDTKTQNGVLEVTEVTPQPSRIAKTSPFRLLTSIPERVFTPIGESWGLTSVTSNLPAAEPAADPFTGPYTVQEGTPVAVTAPQPLITDPVPETWPTPKFPAARPRPLAGLPDPFAVPDPLPSRSDPSAPLVLDLETGGAEALLTSAPGTYVRLVVVGEGDDVAATADVDAALELVRSSTGTIETVNGALFDLPALDRHHGIPVEETVPRVHDMRLVAFQADPPTSQQTKAGPGFKSYSMDALMGRYLGGAKSADGKALAKEYGGWDAVPVDDPRFLEYGRSDGRNTRALARVLPMTDYDRREAKVAAVTARATLSGFRADVPALSARVAELARQREDGKRLLADRYGFPLTGAGGKPSKAPQKTKGGAAAFRAALDAAGFDGLSRWPENKDGSLSLGKDVMAHALAHAHRTSNELAALVISAVQGMNGLRSNADNLLRCVIDGRVHPRFEPFQSTGRWSVTEPGLTVCAKGEPDSERQFLLPDEGDVVVCFDADQVDIRGVAAHSQDPALLEIMCDPARDIHNEVSDDAFGDHEPGHRKYAKTMDLGWLYGRSVNGLAQTPGITREVAVAVDASMRGRFTGVLRWQDQVRGWAEAGNLLDNGFGRRMRCEPDRAYTQAPAMMGQSATRDVVAQGLLTMREKYPHLIPRLRVIVHDEIVMSIPRDRLEEYSAQVIDAMTFTFKGVPMTWGRSVAGDNWNECYIR